MSAASSPSEPLARRRCRRCASRAACGRRSVRPPRGTFAAHRARGRRLARALPRHRRRRGLRGGDPQHRRRPGRRRRACGSTSSSAAGARRDGDQRRGASASTGRSTAPPASRRRSASPPGSALDWLPQETILSSGARLVRRIDVEMAESASLSAARHPGARPARLGRAHAGRHARRSVAIRRGGRLVHAEAVRLDGAIATPWRGPPLPAARARSPRCSTWRPRPRLVWSACGARSCGSATSRSRPAPGTASWCCAPWPAAAAACARRCRWRSTPCAARRCRAPGRCDASIFRNSGYRFCDRKCVRPET